MMLQIPKLLNKMIICILIITFILVTSNKLCELHIKLGISEIEAIMACGS